MTTRPLRLVVPARDAGPSGGDVYDARLAAAWERDHGPVDVVALPGPWPGADPDARWGLARALTGSAPVVVDGLVAGACPDEVERAVAEGTRVVVLIHLPLPAETGLSTEESRRLAQLESRTVRAASDVVVTSHWSARDVARRYGRASIVAAPGAARAAPAVGGSPPHLLVLAALTAVKNHAALIPVLTGVRDLPWDATFAGPTGGQPEVAERVGRRLGETGLAGRVDMPGTVRGDDLELLWRRTDLLLVPSLVETYGQVVTEALAHGVPAVVASGTGAVEALTGPGRDTGSTAGAAQDIADTDAWRHTLRDWLTNPDLRSHWRGAALRRRGELRTWRDTAADLLRGLFPDG